MTDAVASDFNALMSERIDAAHQMLAARWLAQLQPLVPVPQQDIFPGEQPLGQIATLIRQLAGFFRAPGTEAIATNAVVMTTATEIGQLRHAQRASVHQVLREYRALRMVITDFIEEESTRLDYTPRMREVFELTNRLDAAIDVLLRITVDTFVSRYTETITEHTARLEGFNRVVTHELRQPLGTLQFALKLLAAEDTWGDREKRDRILISAERNLARVADTLARLEILSPSEGPDTALVQHVDLSTVVNDMVGQLREMANERDVDVRVMEPLPAVTADRARLELVLLNIISNAIKYSDPVKPHRFVEIAAATSERSNACIISVRDNGVGMAERETQAIFRRFYRAHAVRDAELGTSGMGLGLSIVADCVEALNGSVRVESSPGEGTAFYVELPFAPAL